MYAACVRSAMLHAMECLALTADDISKLQKTDRAMIRWIWGVKLKDRVSSEVLLQKLKIPSVVELCRLNRLRWFGHVERSQSWIKRCTEMVVEGNVKAGGQKKKWRNVVNQDLKLMGILSEVTEDRSKWREMIHQRVRRNMNYQNSSTQ